LTHNFGSRYARNPIKGSKDSDDHLVSKETLSQKIGSLVRRPEWGEFSQQDEKTPSLVTTHTENPKPKIKNIFLFLTRRLSEFVDGMLNSSV